MKAYVYEHGQLKLKDVDVQTLGKEDVLVSLKVAGLNRRDIAIPNRLGDEQPAIVLGSDGAGVIEQIGKNVDQVEIGDEVIINPALGWDENSDAPPEGFEILGVPDNGTIAEKIVITQSQVEKKPEHLTWQEAGVLALASLTGFRAMFTKGQLQKGETVFIPGASSGVATYMIQFAKAVGARVIVSSRSEEKRRQALDIGADIAIDTAANWQEELKDETIDLVIESVGRATFNRSLNILKRGGKIVVFGATTEDTVEFNLREFFYGQYQLFGSTMGSREELQSLLKFMEEHKIHPIVGHTFSLDDIEEAVEYLKENKQFGKIAIEI